MKKSIIIALLFCFIYVHEGISQSSAKKKGEDITIGKTYTFTSEKLSGSWKVQVSLPSSYDKSRDVYPVVYALHGDFYFNFAVGGLQRLMEFGEMPEVIIVGISNESNAYFAYGSESADQFLDFLEADVFPFVEGEFRTHRDRTVMGWHYTSGFIFHTLSKRPRLFSNYIPASPYLGGYDVSEIDFDELSKLMANQSEEKKRLYFGVFGNERSVTQAARSLDSLLQKKAPEQLDWGFKVLKPDYDKGIEISVYRLWQAGLKTVYADYREAQVNFKDLADFKARGGLAALRKHYAERALKYGGMSRPPGLISLIRMAERANDFPLFEELMSVFGSDFEGLNLNRLMGFAGFYKQHGKTEKTIAIYENINTWYPNSISVYAALAGAFMDNENLRKARKAYQKAIVLAEMQSDNRLASLKRKLSALE